VRVETKFENGEVVINIHIPIRTEVNAEDALRIPRLALTPSEAKIFPLLSKGLTNKEVGNAIGMTERTVKSHVSNLLLKFNFHSRIDFVRNFGIMKDEAA
jgi:DNA-binding NarL/FixJ family response regulator